MRVTQVPARSPRVTRYAAAVVLAAVAAVAAVVGVSVRPASAAPPGIPSKATAQSQLNALIVATQGSTSGYSRDLVPALDHDQRQLQHP